MENRDLKMAEKIAACVADKGGRTFLVGGYVRDLLMGKHSKDIDIEIHGVQPKQLENILDGLGSRTEMGASFGVYGLRGYDIDIAMPRQEEATGRGHKDFKIYVDPFLGTYKAAMRRDFTINAMMQDVLTGEIIDHFGGQEDLKKGVLRHVNHHTFAEDPLRVLRAAQFAARFSFSIAPETIELSQTMDLTTLAHERVMSELEKALLKAAHPSIFFEQMHKMNQLDDWFLHLTQLIGVKQPKKYHPEGDVWNHTMQVLDSAALLRSKAENPLGFMLTAVVHDFGKIISTTEENGEIHSYDHAKKGDPLVKEFLERITNETKLIRYVRNLASLHMRPYELAREQAGKKATNQMFDSATVPSDLILFSTADQMGKGKGQIIPEYEDFLKERLDWYQYTMAQPCVMGADLIKAGLKPGPKFSEILAYSHDLHLSNVPKEEALDQTLAFARRLA